MALLPVCFFGNEFTATENGKIPCSDLGVLRGYGIFDYFRTYGRKPFSLDDYLARFANSAKLLRLDLPLSHSELSTCVKELISRNIVAATSYNGEIACRLVLTGGDSADSIRLTGESNFFIMAETVPDNAAEIARKGMAVITHNYQRYLPEVKSTNYLTSIHLQPQLDAAGAAEVIYTLNNSVFEGSRSNIFLFSKETLVTPKDGILLGNTRKALLSLARGEFEIEERPVSYEELRTAEEVFISASGRLINGVTAIDGKPVGSGVCGKRTLHLLDKFLTFANQG